MHEAGIYTKYFRVFKKLHKFLLFWKRIRVKVVKINAWKWQENNYKQFMSLQKEFPPLISFILRAWAKLNPNFNVLNYLVMYMRYLKPWRYPKPKFLTCKRHTTRFFVHRYFCQIFGIFDCLPIFHSENLQ